MGWVADCYPSYVQLGFQPPPQMTLVGHIWLHVAFTVVLLLLSSCVRLMNLLGIARRGNVSFLTTSIALSVSEFAAGLPMVTASPCSTAALVCGSRHVPPPHFPLAVRYPSLQAPFIVLFPLLL